MAAWARRPPGTVSGTEQPAATSPEVVSIPPVGDESEPFTIVGHRGAMARILENVASFQEAERVGSTELELDIRPSADGRIVVVHDRDLDRIAADDAGRGKGDVSAMTSAGLPCAMGIACTPWNRCTRRPWRACRSRLRIRP